MNQKDMFPLTQYLHVAFPTEAPKWHTEHEVIHETKAYDLLEFTVPQQAKPPAQFNYAGIPTLIVPPQAGHASTIADHADGQSIVQTTLAQRQAPVFAIEWKSATFSRRKESLDDLYIQLLEAVSHIGPCHIVGLCQGGWLSTILAATAPELIKSLTCIASPIDFHTGNNAMHKMVQEIGYPAYQAIVTSHNGMMPGSLMLTGWKSAEPVDRYITDYTTIMRAIANGDEEKLEKIHKFRTWYEYTQDLAGAWYLEAIDKLFLKNSLVKGELSICEEKVSLSNITAPTVLIGGTNDRITEVEQVFALGDYITSQHILETTLQDVGHIGCFMARISQGEIAKTIAWIDNQS